MLRVRIRRDLVDYAPIDFVFKVNVPFASRPKVITQTKAYF